MLISLMALTGATTAMRASIDLPNGSNLADGSMQQGVEEAFDDALPHKALSLYVWNAMRFSVFGETEQGALKGEDGWLFTAEEFSHSEKDSQTLARHLAMIAEVSDTLEAQGTNLIVALLPDKARVYADRHSYSRAPWIDARYQSARSALIAAGVDTPDLESAFMDARDIAPGFLERDTHWTPFGARIVAQSVAQPIAEFDLETTPFDVSQSDFVSHRGDLINFVETGPFADHLGLTPETLAQFDVFPAVGSLGLFDDPLPVEVALVGTSYSADPKWQFADFLKYEAQLDVMNFAKVGVGPFAPMQDFMDGLANSEETFSIVVWEIPERYLTILEY